MKYHGTEAQRMTTLTHSSKLLEAAAAVARSLALGDEPHQDDMAEIARHSAALLGVDPEEGWQDIIADIDARDAADRQRDREEIDREQAADYRSMTGGN